MLFERPAPVLCDISVVEAHQPDLSHSAQSANRIVIGIGRGALNCDNPSGFDLLLTDVADAPPPWVEVPNIDKTLARARDTIALNPFASVTLAHILRSTETLDFENALAVELIAYSMLLGAREFARWRSTTPRRNPVKTGEECIRIDLEDNVLHISLARPSVRNAFNSEMRDLMVDALAFAESQGHRILLTGDGPDFCAGGDLDEFGTANDPGEAHIIRMQHSPARLVHRLSQQLTARLHGACIGAGIEIPAAASRLVARADSWFRLPEVVMGLIPGAGGTVTIPRRIGRHRTCYLALSGQRLTAAEALHWGLIDEIDG